MFDGCLDGSDGMGFGPLFLTESEKTLMERVRQELKHELKQVEEDGYNFSHELTYRLPNELSDLLGLQRENCGHQRRDCAEAKSWETPRRCHFYFEGLVAVPFQMAIPNGAFTVSATGHSYMRSLLSLLLIMSSYFTILSVVLVARCASCFLQLWRVDLAHLTHVRSVVQLLTPLCLC
ncbi:hypothetical protein GW17_00055814 [Ensete ventricosum]|nr:hypothetical protein GW17_00055814 [Ensete ventricosum]